MYRLENTSVLSVEAVAATEVATSASFDDRLAETYQRVGMTRGKLEELAGVHERRWWAPPTTFVDGAVQAGQRALAAAEVDPSDVGIMINTSVCRTHLEPSMAVQIHHRLGLSAGCLNFDLANACLGFVNAMQIAGTMIDAGQARYALIVNGEGTREGQLLTLERLARAETTADEVRAQFATLTLGSGAAAMVLGPSRPHPRGHQLLGGASRAGTEHHGLCVGTMEQMHTDSHGLFEAGLELVLATWKDAEGEFDWDDMTAYVAHQTSVAHLQGVCAVLGLDMARFPLTLPTFGNMGPVAVPFTLAQHAPQLAAGDRVLLMGIGSGLNTSFAELRW